MKKMYFPLFLALILVAFVLVACGGEPIADKVIKDVVDPPDVPTLGDPILLVEGQPIEVTNGEITLTIEYLGKETSGHEKWSCQDGQGHSCAERHSNHPEMVFYHDFKLVGATLNGSILLISDWEVSP